MKYYIGEHIMAIDNRNGLDNKFPIKLGNIVPELEVTLIQREDEFYDLKEDWELLTKYARVEIFQTFGWLKTWWKYFGRKDALYILAIRHEGVLVGLAPFYKMITPRKSRINISLHFLGSPLLNKNESLSDFYKNTCNYNDFIIHPDYEQSVVKVILTYLIEYQDDFNEINLLELPENSVVLRELIPILKKRGLKYQINNGSSRLKINLPSSINEFLSSIDYKFRNKINESIQSYRNHQLYEVHNINEKEELIKALDFLIKIKKRKRQEENSRLLNNYISFIYDISKSLLEHDRLIIKRAEIKNTYIAVNYAIKYKETIYDYLKGVDVFSSFINFGPNQYLETLTIVDAIKQNVKIRDCFNGDIQDSFKLNTYSIQNYEIVIQLSQE